MCVPLATERSPPKNKKQKNAFGACHIAHNPRRTSVDMRLELNGMLVGNLPFGLFGKFFLQPMLRWIFEGMLNGDFETEGIMPHMLTDKDADGSKGSCDKGMYTLLFQLHGYLVHCLKGKNRTALALLAILLAVYHETELSVDDAIEYLLQMRPVMDFAVHDRFGSPVVCEGGDS